jgi:transposase
MMGERRVMQEALFYGFSLERRVPDNHLLRKIDRFVDLSEVRKHPGPYYSDVGRPSIDPELMIRMLIVGYGFGIRSERRLCEEVHLNLAYRWFCRLGLDADVPDHSTFSKNRHGRFRESDLLRKLFETVVARCMKEGIVGGEAFAVDASIIVADAHRRRGVGKSKISIRPQAARSPNIFRFSMTRPSAGRRRSSRRRSRRPIQRPATQPRPTSRRSTPIPTTTLSISSMR